MNPDDVLAMRRVSSHLAARKPAKAKQVADDALHEHERRTRSVILDDEGRITPGSPVTMPNGVVGEVVRCSPTVNALQFKDGELQSVTVYTATVRFPDGTVSRIRNITCHNSQPVPTGEA